MPFDRFRSRFEVAGTPQGFERARIAHAIDYDVEANWKLVWENNRECYHCTPRHPQYVKSNFDVYEEEHASPAVRQKIARSHRPHRSAMGGARRWASRIRRAAWPRSRTPTTGSGTRATARRLPKASSPNRWTAHASRR
jgi:phenylpropionate dioxygenase-like ring-hydroxylating dioxygenase large terminal subunit